MFPRNDLLIDVRDTLVFQFYEKEKMENIENV